MRKKLCAVTFRSLWSGSEGNLYLLQVEPEGEKVINVAFDWGLSGRQFASEMNRIHEPAHLNSVILSHADKDHINLQGLRETALRMNRPLRIFLPDSYAEGPFLTSDPLRKKAFADNIIHSLESDERFTLGQFCTHETFYPVVPRYVSVTSFPLMHSDPNDESRLIFSHDTPSVGFRVRIISGFRQIFDFTVVSDLGTLSSHTWDNIWGTQALFMECNYDESIMAQHPVRYASDGAPYAKDLALRERIASRLGHLSNQQVSRFLRYVNSEEGWDLKVFGALHMSGFMNDPEVALAILRNGDPGRAETPKGSGGWLTGSAGRTEPTWTRARKFDPTVLLACDGEGNILFDKITAWADEEVTDIARAVGEHEF